MSQHRKRSSSTAFLHLLSAHWDSNPRTVDHESGFSFSTCNYVGGAARRPTLGKREILSWGVHFAADKNSSCKWACNEDIIIIFKILIHPAFINERPLIVFCFFWLVTYCSPATLPGSDAVGRHSSFNMRDMFWATTTRLLLLKTHCSDRHLFTVKRRPSSRGLKNTHKHRHLDNHAMWVA